MFGSDFDILQNPFADRDAWNDDDELLKAVASGKLENGSEVDVGLSSSGFHFNGEVRAKSTGIRERVKEIPAFKRGISVGNLDIVSFLDESSVLNQSIIGQEKVVPNPKFGTSLTGKKSIVCKSAHVDDRELGLPKRLAVE